jgi:type I restriction enzyme M protein
MRSTARPLYTKTLSLNYSKVEDFFQGSNYAAYADATFFVATNEKETKFFKAVKGIIPKDLEEIINIPHAKDINNEKRLSEILSQTKTFTRDEFQRLLFACHDVIRNNDKLSPKMAFDEISKILFMKIRYERQKDNTLFSEKSFRELQTSDRRIRGKEADITPFYQFLFQQTKQEFSEDKIFEENDILRIRETSFLQIVKLLEKYNLSNTSDDVKGIAFEEFLGKTFRGDLGQFFTPAQLSISWSRF